MTRPAIRLYARRHGARADARAVIRRARSFSREPSATPPPARTTTSKLGVGTLGLPAPTCRSRAPRWIRPARRSISRTTSACRIRSFPSSDLILEPAVKHKFRLQFIPLTTRRRRRRGRTLDLQRPALQRRRAGQLDARLEGVALRVRVRLHRAPIAASAGSSSTSSTPTSTRRSPARSAIGLRRTRRRRSRRIGGIFGVYPSRQPVDHRRDLPASRWPGQLDQERHDRPLRRLRLLRDVELHQQHRRAGRLSLVRRRLHADERHRRASR